MRCAAIAVLFATLAACDTGSASNPQSPSAVGPPPEEISVEQVTTLTDPATLGQVVAVAEMAGSFVAFGEKGAIPVQAGIAGSGDDAVKAWTSAISIFAPDGTGRWPVATDDGGRLLRLRDDGRIEDVGSRYGVARADHVKSIVAVDEASFLLVLDTSLVFVDGATQKTTLFDTGPLDHVSAAKGHVAGATANDVRVLDLASGRQETLPLAGVIGTAFAATGEVFALTDHAVHRAERGAFSPVARRDDVVLHGIASSAGQVWFGAGAELYALDAGRARRARAITLSAAANIAAAPNGDLWLFGDVLARVRAGAVADDAAWTTGVLPIYQSICSACHAPNGSSGVDLSTATNWRARRQVVVDRVLVKQNMPPRPQTLTADQLAAIQRWADAP